jgi:hypothetical protein
MLVLKFATLWTHQPCFLLTAVLFPAVHRIPFLTSFWTLIKYILKEVFLATEVC